MELDEYLTIVKDNGYLRICALNMRFYNADEIFDEQFDQIGKIQPDIIMLTEYSHKYSEEEMYDMLRQGAEFELINNIESYRKVLSERCKLLKVKYVVTAHEQSHCGIIILLIKKEILHNTEVVKENVISSFKNTGYNIISVKTKFGNLTIGAVHLSPFKTGMDKRKSQLECISKFVDKYDYPCIIAGDFNMRDIENNIASDLGFNDAYFEETERDEDIYNTWPNVLCRTDRQMAKITNTFRFDRILYKKCKSKNFKTINTYNSDHLMIACDIKVSATV